MKFRKKLSHSGSKKLFTATADLNHIHPKNAQVSGGPLRGGIRL